MTATVTVLRTPRPAPTCAPWCLSHTQVDFHSDNAANEACLSADVEVTDSLGQPFSFGLGLDSVVGALIDVNGREFTPEGAREVIRTIEGLIRTAEATA